MGEDCCAGKEGMPHDGRHCGCGHHKIIPFIVLVIGIMFFLQAVGTVDPVLNAKVWPVLVILAALIKLTSGKCKCYKK